MGDPPKEPVQEQKSEPYDVNDVKTKKNPTTREQYYGDYLSTTMARSMTQ